jgi:hypothetical protein
MNPLNSATTRTFELSSPVWFFLPRTIAYFQNCRSKIDRTKDDFIPNGLNYTIITLAVFYLEGCLEGWLRQTICSVETPENPMLHKLHQNLLSGIGRVTSAAAYNEQVELVYGKKLSELCANRWEGFQILFALRGVLAHGRMVQVTIITEGDTRENSFDGNYGKVWDYLKKNGLVSDKDDDFDIGYFCLRDLVADYWVNFSRLFISELGASLDGKPKVIFDENRYVSETMWHYP